MNIVKTKKWECRDEIARRFLIDMKSESEDDSHKQIVRELLEETSVYEGYIIDERKIKILRREISRGMGTAFYEGHKEGIGLKTTIVRKEISQKEFAALRQKIKCSLWKMKYRIRCGESKKPMIELCRFYYYDLRGNNNNFWIAKVKFETFRESEKFVVPDWFGREITDDERYDGYNLAKKGLPRKDAAAIRLCENAVM
ncbi:MAG TPA: hypothetical protein PLF30_03425 [Candidatus Moranbacteria bacterium]|jgi:hypothetical protein|nr:hypothetical protein [Candidatus Moranbacteria bacterium]HOF42419.1 hypothetical protein [Candidatus Moranbacteria bacterium]HPX94578.1 hypothetical protein [Candidatus Moranbacteria bacterium]HQB59544.1 hypothetical protein [Candidatus Moranbacteria bacterium]